MFLFKESEDGSLCVSGRGYKMGEILLKGELGEGGIEGIRFHRELFTRAEGRRSIN